MKNIIKKNFWAFTMMGMIFATIPTLLQWIWKVLDIIHGYDKSAEAFVAVVLIMALYLLEGFVASIAYDVLKEMKEGTKKEEA